MFRRRSSKREKEDTGASADPQENAAATEDRADAQSVKSGVSVASGSEQKLRNRKGLGDRARRKLRKSLAKAKGRPISPSHKTTADGHTAGELEAMSLHSMARSDAGGAQTPTHQTMHPADVPAPTEETPVATSSTTGPETAPVATQEPPKVTLPRAPRRRDSHELTTVPRSAPPPKTDDPVSALAMAMGGASTSTHESHEHHAHSTTTTTTTSAQDMQAAATYRRTEDRPPSTVSFGTAATGAFTAAKYFEQHHGQSSQTDQHTTTTTTEEDDWRRQWESEHHQQQHSGHRHRHHHHHHHHHHTESSGTESDDSSTDEDSSPVAPHPRTNSPTKEPCEQEQTRLSVRERAQEQFERFKMFCSRCWHRCKSVFRRTKTETEVDTDETEQEAKESLFTRVCVKPFMKLWNWIKEELQNIFDFMFKTSEWASKPVDGALETTSDHMTRCATHVTRGTINRSVAGLEGKVASSSFMPSFARRKGASTTMTTSTTVEEAASTERTEERTTVRIGSPRPQ